MGKSPSIQELASKDEAFQSYLQNLQTQLASKSAAASADLQKKIDAFYKDNKYTDAQDLVSGQHYDFIHEQEFTLANMKSIVDAISHAVFAGSGTTDGATVSADGTQAAEKALGPEVGEMANLELYIASQVFDVLSNVILSFGTSTGITFNTDIQSKSLGYGLQMFTSVSADSYQSQSFFNNEYIYEYLYQYDVKFSQTQAKAEIGRTLIELYEDRIAAFKELEEKLLPQLESGKLTAAAYQTTNDSYDALIAQIQAKVAQLKSSAAAAARHA